MTKGASQMRLLHQGEPRMPSTSKGTLASVRVRVSWAE